MKLRIAIWAGLGALVVVFWSLLTSCNILNSAMELYGRWSI